KLEGKLSISAGVVGVSANCAHLHISHRWTPNFVCQNYATQYSGRLDVGHDGRDNNHGQQASRHDYRTASKKSTTQARGNMTRLRKTEIKYGCIVSLLSLTTMHLRVVNSLIMPVSFRCSGADSEGAINFAF